MKKRQLLLPAPVIIQTYVLAIFTPNEIDVILRREIATTMIEDIENMSFLTIHILSLQEKAQVEPVTLMMTLLQLGVPMSQGSESLAFLEYLINMLC